MDIISLLLIAVGLAMDVFAVSLGVGTSRFGDSKRTRTPPGVPLWIISGWDDISGLVGGYPDRQLDSRC